MLAVLLVYVYMYPGERGHHERRWGSWGGVLYIYIYIYMWGPLFPPRDLPLTVVVVMTLKSEAATIVVVAVVAVVVVAVVILVVMVVTVYE